MTLKNNPYLHQRLSEIGEKALIRDFIKPFFNGSDDPAGVGDDCAMVPFGDEVALLSTDRVPSDLTAFKLGILDFHGLGDYLARLNLSDIAACGGRAVGLLLNLGLPNDIAYEDVQALCRGFGGCAERHGATVLGGDITSACELSISATSIGKAIRGQVLTRSEEHTSELQSPCNLVCRLLLEKKQNKAITFSLDPGSPTS